MRLLTPYLFGHFIGCALDVLRLLSLLLGGSLGLLEPPPPFYQQMYRRLGDEMGHSQPISRVHTSKKRIKK